jgi:hypothetical protein
MVLHRHRVRLTRVRLTWQPGVDHRAAGAQPERPPFRLSPSGPVLNAQRLCRKRPCYRRSSGQPRRPGSPGSCGASGRAEREVLHPGCRDYSAAWPSSGARPSLNAAPAVIDIRLRLALRRCAGAGTFPFLWVCYRFRGSPWHCLNFLPEPQGHGAFRPTLAKLSPLAVAVECVARPVASSLGAL